MKADDARRLCRVVLDTNVWISAALSSGGVPNRVVQYVLERARPVFSDVTFGELETRLWRPKFDRYLSIDLRRRLLHDLDAISDRIEISPEWSACRWSRDPDDDHFIRLALAARAPVLVSGDADLLEVAPIDGLAILAPAQALHEWTRA